MRSSVRRLQVQGGSGSKGLPRCRTPGPSFGRNQIPAARSRAYLCDLFPADGVAFTREGNLVRKATGYEQEKAETALSPLGFAGGASRASGAHWSVSVTHRFLRRGLNILPIGLFLRESFAAWESYTGACAN